MSVIFDIALIKLYEMVSVSATLRRVRVLKECDESAWRRVASCIFLALG